MRLRLDAVRHIEAYNTCARLHDVIAHVYLCAGGFQWDSLGQRFSGSAEVSAG